MSAADLRGWFGRATIVRAAGDHFVIGSNDTYEIRAYSQSGTLKTAIRKQIEPLSVSEHDLLLMREPFDALEDGERKVQ